MGKKLYVCCVFITIVLFLGFISLYAYVWIADDNPKEIKPGFWDWRSISIGHGTISIAHSLKPTAIKINMLTYPYDGDGNLHIAITKNTTREMCGCHLIFFNQNIPFEGIRIFSFAEGDKIISKSGFMGYGIKLGSGTHSTSMIGCFDNDRTTETVFKGYGILLFDLKHTVEKDKNWWTLMISLWYRTCP